MTKTAKTNNNGITSIFIVVKVSNYEIVGKRVFKNISNFFDCNSYFVWNIRYNSLVAIIETTRIVMCNSRKLKREKCASSSTKGIPRKKTNNRVIIFFNLVSFIITTKSSISFCKIFKNHLVLCIIYSWYIYRWNSKRGLLYQLQEWRYEDGHQTYKLL